MLLNSLKKEKKGKEGLGEGRTNTRRSRRKEEARGKRGDSESARTPR